MSEKYFDIVADFYKNILFITVKGVWDLDIALKYRSEFKKTVEPLIVSGEPWYVIADISEYPPQSEEVQSIHRELMDFAKNNGMIKAANIVTDKIYEEHVRQLSEDSGLVKFDFFKDVDEAEQWIVSEETGLPE